MIETDLTCKRVMDEMLFNCLKCTLNFDDVKLLKTHYWKVHISSNEMFLANNKLNEKQIETVSDKSNGLTNGKKRSSKSEIVSKSSKKIKVEKKNDDDNDDDKEMSETVDNQIPKDPQDELLNVLDGMNDDDFKYYNFEPSINESEIFERSAKLRPHECNKLKEMKPGKIGWAEWRYKGKIIMWPCTIEKLVKVTQSKYKVAIKYFEKNDQTSSMFKLDLHKVELFFRNQKHFNYKTFAANFKQLRYDYMSCYTTALKNYVKELESEEQNPIEEKSTAVDETLDESKLNESANIQSNSSLVKSQKKNPNKYSICGKTYSIDEIKDMAQRPLSENQIKTNQERESFSKNLIDILNTEECKDFIKSIFEENTSCKRHLEYLKANAYTRRNKMKFSSPGPLVDEDQQTLAKLVEELSKEHYQSKPGNLDKYEYDVLYPEAVIWALIKHENLSYSKAELKYKQGFKRTEEEIIRQRCNEILNKLNTSLEDANCNKQELDENKNNQNEPENEPNGLEDSKLINETDKNKKNNDDTQIDCDPNISFEDV